VYREREKEREKERKNREKTIFFLFFLRKKRLPPNKKIKKIKKMLWDQDPGLRCPGALVPGIPSKGETSSGPTCAAF
jgi:hypothetical protein